MKILRINKCFYLKGGAERHYFALSELLERNGHTVIPFSMQDKRNRPTPYAKYFIRNIDYTKFSLKNIVKFFYNREAVKNLEQLIEHERPDIAHLHNVYHQLTPAIIDVLKKHRIPVVMTLHDLKAVCPHYNVLHIDNKMCCDCQGKYFYRHLLGPWARRSFADFVKGILFTLESYHNARRYRQVDLFIAPSLFFKRMLVRAGFGERVVYLPHFYNAEGAAPPDAGASSLAGAPDYIMYAGRLSVEKGVRDLIMAMNAVYRRRAGDIPRLLVAGDGPERDALVRLARHLKMEDKIVFTGHLDVASLYGYLRGARAVVVPSACYENAPNAVIEAMLLTKIVICAKVGGLADMLEDGISGFFFKIGDTADMARVIEQVVFRTAEDTLRGIAAKGRERILLTRDPEHYYQKILALYQSVT